MSEASDPDGAAAAQLRARNAFFDRVAARAVERGVRQLVSIGAGDDRRESRQATPGVRWFDLDAPSAPDRADPAPGAASGALVEQGFEPDAPAMFLLEAPLTDLPRDTVVAVLGDLRALATAGTRLALAGPRPGPGAAVRRAAARRPSGGTDPVALLVAARWRRVELSERAARAGLTVAAPQWTPGRPPTRSRIGGYLERTFHRDGLDELADHLADTYGVPITGQRRLDVGVVRIERVDGPPWVARVFPADRPLAATRADADTLAFLARAGFPAERPAAPDPISELHGQAVLVTQFVTGGRLPKTVAATRRLGELLGRLHTLPDAPDRPGGGWHHLVDGPPSAELAAVGDLLDARAIGRLAEYESLRAELAAADDLADLPAAFTHPDFVAENAIAGPDPVLVDWAGAGVAARIWTLGFLLWAAHRRGPTHVTAACAGYREHVRLTRAEIDRLPAAVSARPLVLDAWTCATGRRPPAQIAAGRASVRDLCGQIAQQATAALVG